MRAISLVFLLLNSVVSAAEFRELITENGSRVKVDIETHRVYVQVQAQAAQSTPEQVAPSLAYWVSSNREVFVNPEFNHFVQIEPPSSMSNPPAFSPSPNLGTLGVPLQAPPGGPNTPPPPGTPSATETMLRSTTIGANPDVGYVPTAPISQGQATILIQAVNDIFGPGIPVRDYSGIENAANQNAALAARLRSEAEALRNYQPTPHQLPTYQPSEEQIRRYREHRILDVPSIPDPADSDLPYQFQCQGPEREELVRLYKHLYKISPETEKRKNARELGLIAVQEADSSFKNGEIEEGTFFKNLGEGFLDLAIGIDPITGLARSTYELIAGRNFVTGARLGNWEYGFAALNILTLGGEGIINSTLKGLSKIVSRGTNLVRTSELTAEGIRTAEKVVDTVSGAAKNRAAFERYVRDLRETMQRPHAQDPQLLQLMEQQYRPAAQIGAGSTAAAIRYERATGELVGGRSHVQKGFDHLEALRRWLSKNPAASPGDKAAAENVKKDLEDALRGLSR